MPDINNVDYALFCTSVPRTTPRAWLGAEAHVHCARALVDREQIQRENTFLEADERKRLKVGRNLRGPRPNKH